jgi:hypothetical protein
MPLTFLDWRRSHHQAIGPIRHRVIPTGSLRPILKDRVAIYLETTSKDLRIAEYQQTYEALEDQINALYQATEDA